MKFGGFQPFTLSDYPANCAAIVFCSGCNLRCPYCHNKELWSSSLSTISEEEVIKVLLFRKSLLKGLVISGGEPTLQGDSLVRFMNRVKELDYFIKIDTNGTDPKLIEEMISSSLVDFIAMDIKSPFQKYTELTNTAVDIRLIQKSINIIVNSGLAHLFRTTWDKTRLTEEDIEIIKEIIPAGSQFVLQKCRYYR